MPARAVVWAGPATSALVAKCLDPKRHRIAGSRTEFEELLRSPGAVAIVDDAHLPKVEAITAYIPVVAVSDQPFNETLHLFDTFPWLSHVISSTTLAGPHGSHHLSVALTAVWANDPNLLGFVGAPANGRVSRITKSTERHRRLDRFSQFLEKRKIGARTAALARDVGEELLTNAIYNAPAAAGVFKGMAVPRTKALALSPEYACEMLYGISNHHVFVRVRDEFGSFTRRRLMEVLLRCAKTDMSVLPDESMGGAGLGLWRIFRVASVVVIAVHPGRSCEFLVCLAHRAGSSRAATQRGMAIHLFFDVEEGARRARALATKAPQLEPEEEALDPMDRSVTFVRS
jgi:hypothetical protein